MLILGKWPSRAREVASVGLRVIFKQMSNQLRIDSVDKKTDKEDLITRYFLGELSEEEKSRVEQQFLTDGEFFELMLSIENALIDDYVREKLSERERRKIETLLQSSNRLDPETKAVKRLIEDLARAKSLAPQAASPSRRERPSKWQALLEVFGIRGPGKRFSFALLGLPMILAAALLGWNIMLQRDLSQMKMRQVGLEESNQELARRLDAQAGHDDKLNQEIEDARRENEEIRQEIASIREARPGAGAPDTATLALTVEASTRGSGALKTVRLGPNTQWLRVIVDTGRDDFAGYSMAIHTFDGQLIWSKENLRPAQLNRSRVVLTLPGSRFTNQDYTLSLKGQTEAGPPVELGDYSFRVKK